jgi:quinol monooxygenase YgiN
VGPGPVFLLNGASFLAVIFALYRWPRHVPSSVAPAERLLAAMRAGLRYAKHAPAFQAVLIRTGCFVFFGSVVLALLPTLARHELDLGSVEYGLLLGSLGLGAIGGAVALPPLRQRFSTDVLTALATLLWAGVISAFAFVRVLPVLIGIMLVGGMAWITLIASFNVAAQTAVPSWVRGRSLAVYMVAFQGGIAAGSATWGAIANYAGLEWAFLSAAIGLVVALVATLRYRLPGGEGPDLAPSMHWPVPLVACEPSPEHGPVLVQVEYYVGSDNSDEFVAAMEALERIRRRDGAYRWGLFRDIAQPDRWVETFLVESWSEHLRQHERITVKDRGIEERVGALLTQGSRPVVTHLIWGTAQADGVRQGCD